VGTGGDGHCTTGTCVADFTCGTSTVTFTYKGSQVTYGTVLGNAGECWMDRNLGASRVATDEGSNGYNDYLAYGDLFQWGREDDGHQGRSCTGPTTCTSDYGTVEGDMTLTDQPGDNLFITVQTSAYDWANNSWITRWTVAASDPCPSGWRVPTDTEWSAEEATFSPQSYVGAYNSPLKLTAGGFRLRTDGSLGNVGTYGRYWSSVVSGTYAWSLYFHGSGSFMYRDYRALGFSVRCVQD